MFRRMIWCLPLAGLFWGCQPDSRSQDWVAVVNGRPVTLAQFQDALDRVGQLPGKDFSTNEKKRAFLQEMIKQELLFQSAVKEHFVEGSDRLRREIALEYLAARVGGAQSEPSEEALQELYEKQKADLEEVRASHILIKPPDPKSEASREQARRKAEDLRKRILADPDPDAFGKAAKEFSQDLSNRDQGGDLGWFDRGRMVPAFSQAAFALARVGDVSPVVTTQFGCHLIRLTGERRGLEPFRAALKSRLTQEQRTKAADELFRKLEADSSVKIFDESLARARVARSGGNK
jgi:peptidyl-prolyl cis-trans isomerase C